MNCNYIKKNLYKRRKKLLKTFTWRAIATTTTFVVAFILTDEIGKSGTIAAVDTVVKTIFYYFHEGAYDKATKKKWSLCVDYVNTNSEDNNLEDNNLEDNNLEDNRLENNQQFISEI
uniref:Putative membrane protein n=1 Tax=Megaviridae environmental sample TaxID=1737588 RepID=A0A5J6VKC4_9VIRU|nr:MAG: putative membrane protein [Megaviridae environmental sample]